MEYAPHDRIPMQYLIIDAVPDPTFEHKEDHAGATVGCWIKEQTTKNAYHISRGWIEENGWVVLNLDEQYPITEQAYEDEPDGKEYFEQAQIDGEVFAPYEATIPIVFVSFGPPYEEVVHQSAPLNDPEAIFYIPRTAVAVIANGLETVYSPLVYLDFQIMSETFSPSLAVQYSLWN